MIFFQRHFSISVCNKLKFHVLDQILISFRLKTKKKHNILQSAEKNSLISIELQSVLADVFSDSMKMQVPQGHK